MKRGLVRKIIKALLPYGVLCIYRILMNKLYISSKTRNINKLQIKNDNSPKFIITLTSYGQRVHKKCPFAIRSLLNQSVQPDKIILWLGYGTKVPASLKKLEKYGLEIKFCEDIGPYTKLIPALIDFPNDVLVTADDDICYNNEWFKPLKEAYLSDPTKIYCHRAHEICLDENKRIIPYTEWRLDIKTIEYPKRIFPTGVRGILYPPHCFNNEIFNKDKFLKLTRYADDIWFWAMARHNKKEFKVLKKEGDMFVEIGINNDGLMKVNVGKNRNDEQIQNVINEYPDVYDSIL